VSGINNLSSVSSPSTVVIVSSGGSAMPELPEVETVKRGLAPQLAGRRILEVTLGKTDFVDEPELLLRELPGRVIRLVERYGKFLLLRLEAAKESVPSRDDGALLVHLGMTGWLVPQAASQPRAKHTHAALLLDDGRELRYVDQRRFGRMAYLDRDRLETELRRWGADPLETSRPEFERRITGRRARVKALLLDQRVLRGVGNIYADESLWRAKIHPAVLGSRLSKQTTDALYHALRRILLRAIRMRGSTISDFLDAEGLPGEYQRHHRVYGREGKPCVRCRSLIERVMVAGRSSYVCPHCQRPPRGFRTVGLDKRVRNPNASTGKRNALRRLNSKATRRAQGFF